jgi:hypothetical protein
MVMTEEGGKRAAGIMIGRRDDLIVELERAKRKVTQRYINSKMQEHSVEISLSIWLLNREGYL